MQKYLGEKLLDLRKRKDWTLQTVSRITGVSVSTLHRIETNPTGNHHARTIHKIEKSLEEFL